MSVKVLLDWVLVFALVILAKINQFRISFNVESDGHEYLTFFSQPEDFPTAGVGESVPPGTLECLTLQRDTKVNWYHNGVRVDPDPSTPSSLVRIEVKNRSSSLIIRRLTPDLVGRYHCKAYNAGGAARKGAWINATDASEHCQSDTEDGGTFTKRSGESFSFPGTKRSPRRVLWTKSIFLNPYKLEFFDESSTAGMGGAKHAEVSSDGVLSISSLNILDEGDWTQIIVDDRGCVRQRKYRLEIENSEAKVCGRLETYVIEVDYELDASAVGVRTPRKIIQGHDAPKGSAPWYAGLCIGANRTAKTVNCGGTLIGRKWILTAAHCFFNRTDRRELSEKDVFVKLGSLSPDCTNVDDLYEVKRLIRHPKQNIAGDDFTHDVALLELSLNDKEQEKGIYSNVIRPACYERREFYAQNGRYQPHTMGRYDGLGLVDRDRLIYAKTLQSVEVPLESPEICQVDLAHKFSFNNTICTGYTQGGKDTCKGDSGGPYTMVIQDRRFLVGVVSWGDEGQCAKPGKYGYLMDAGVFYGWVQGVMNGTAELPTAATTPNDYYYDDPDIY